MADVSYPYAWNAAHPRIDWGAVWGGTFTFLAIWAVFGALGVAIFAGGFAPGAGTGVSIGIGIWAIVLTVIALYVAGRETAHLAAVPTRHDGAIHGMIMFGLSVVSMLVLILLGASLSAGTGARGAANSGSVDQLAGLAWAGFIALFLGWLAAMGGASTSVERKPVANPQQIRPAA